MSDAISLSGDLLRLRPTMATDASALIAIRNTEQVRLRWGGDLTETEFLEDLEDDDATQLTIEVDGRTVGLIQFSEEDDDQYRHASIDIYIDPAVHRRGYASDAIRTLVDHLFDERGHHRVTIDPVVDNAAAIACYRSVGFSPVGVMRRYEQQADGSWADGLLMELLDTDRSSASDTEPEMRFAGTVINAANPDRLASFYERLLGWQRFMDDGDWIALRSDSGAGTAIAFQLDEHAATPSWPPGRDAPHALVHMDFVTDDLDAAVDRAVTLGAAIADTQHVATERVMLDPDGNPFCLIASPSAPDAARATAEPHDISR